LAAQGLRTRAVYTQSLKDGRPGELPEALKLLVADGPVDAVITTLSFAIGDSEPHPFALIGVPVIQAIAAGVDRETWRRSGRGLGPLDTAMNVALPEFDGRIIGVPISFKEEATEDQRLGVRLMRYAPMPDRVQFMAALAAAWARLRRTPPAERKVALVLSNYPTKNARI